MRILHRLLSRLAKLVVKPGGEVTFQHISRFNGDNPKPKAIVAAALSAVERRASA